MKHWGWIAFVGITIAATVFYLKWSKASETADGLSRELTQARIEAQRAVKVAADAKADAQAASAPKPPKSLDEAMSLIITESPVVPAADRKGDYLVLDSGVWYLQGAKAYKVAEVQGATPGN